MNNNKNIEQNTLSILKIKLKVTHQNIKDNNKNEGMNLTVGISNK